MRPFLLLATLCVGLTSASEARADSTAASSEARDDAGVHEATLAFDGLLSTDWAEGDEGTGVGSWVEVRMDRATDVVSVSVWPGNLSEGKRSARAWARPRALTISLSGGLDPDSSKQVFLEDIGQTGPQRIDVPIRGSARVVRVTIDEVYEGAVHPDVTCIAEVGVNFAEGEPHPWVGKVYGWIEGDEGKRPRAENVEEVTRLAEQAKGEDDAARLALADLMDQAGDGAPYIRRWVARYVPLGFRIHAIPPNEAAIEALLSLKNPNAIPAIEQASVRVKGHDQTRLSQAVEMFYAYQELIGGPTANVPAWGQSGWARGELRGFGEPLPAEIDQAGRVYVADVANSRVQRFTSTGGVDQVIGIRDPDITDTWIAEKRPWYVSGSRPGEESGALTIPLDIAIVPGKLEDLVAVLDLTGRVQVFGPDGDLRHEVRAPIQNLTILPGVGGQAYLLHSKGQLVVIWGDDAFVYTVEGEKVTGWDVNDGVPSGGTTLKNHKLALIFGSDLVMYSADGFRHGSILGDTLGEGFEAWDVATDEDGKLWAVTDNGWAVKYKKPGKIDARVRLDDRGFVLPRIAVQDDVIYVTDGDRVRVFDFLELQRKAELAAEGS